MPISRLDALRAESNLLRRNRMFQDCLSDDTKRMDLYAELRARGFPTLRLPTVLRTGGTAPWPAESLYFVSRNEDVSQALRLESVEPYSHLGSDGRFMLGLDDPAAHRDQRRLAVNAMSFGRDEIDKAAGLAVERALVLPRKKGTFDAVEDVAEQAALRLIALLFGLPPEAHVDLRIAMQSAYTELTFQIVGRHFATDSGLPPHDTAAALELKKRLEDAIRRTAEGGPIEEGELHEGVPPPERTVIARLQAEGADLDRTTFVALGLMAGLVGNVKAAVAIVLSHYFDNADRTDQARMLVRGSGPQSIGGEPDPLDALIDEALLANPPAAFLARTVKEGVLSFVDDDGVEATISRGSSLLLAIGADDAAGELRFGGANDDEGFVHRCVGRHLAQPLVRRTVRGIVGLPGLARVFDPESGKPKPLVKRWGVDCRSFPLEFQRDRLLNQRSLHVVLPIKAPVAENARRLRLLTEAGAHIVEEALSRSAHVHFAWFNLVENDTHLAMSTVYDGDFDAYVEHFALKVPLFDKQFEYLDVVQPTPIREHPKEFVANIRKYNREPLGGYFFSAYPLTSAAAIRQSGATR